MEQRKMRKNTITLVTRRFLRMTLEEIEVGLGSSQVQENDKKLTTGKTTRRVVF